MKVYGNFLCVVLVLQIIKILAFLDVELNNLTDAVCNQPPVKSQNDFSFIYDNPQTQYAGVPDDVDDLNPHGTMWGPIGPRRIISMRCAKTISFTFLRFFDFVRLSIVISFQIMFSNSTFE